VFIVVRIFCVINTSCISLIDTIISFSNLLFLVGCKVFLQNLVLFNSFTYYCSVPFPPSVYYLFVICFYIWLIDLNFYLVLYIPSVSCGHFLKGPYLFF